MKTNKSLAIAAILLSIVASRRSFQPLIGNTAESCGGVTAERSRRLVSFV